MYWIDLHRGSRWCGVSPFCCFCWFFSSSKAGYFECVPPSFINNFDLSPYDLLLDPPSSPPPPNGTKVLLGVILSLVNCVAFFSSCRVLIQANIYLQFLQFNCHILNFVPFIYAGPSLASSRNDIAQHEFGESWVCVDLKDLNRIEASTAAEGEGEEDGEAGTSTERPQRQNPFSSVFHGIGNIMNTFNDFIRHDAWTRYGRNRSNPFSPANKNCVVDAIHSLGRGTEGVGRQVIGSSSKGSTRDLHLICTWYKRDRHVSSTWMLCKLNVNTTWPKKRKLNFV